MQKPLFILDAYGLIYRSYFAFISRPLVNAQGENTSAIYGFFNNLYNVIRDYKPECFIAAFDSKTPTFRHEMYPEYKANRAKTPEDLHAQIPIIESILTSLGISIIAQDGFEADDIIASVATRCKKENRPCYILSGDKDLMQLVGGSVQVLKPSKEGGWQKMDSADILVEWGIGPELMLDYLSLTGDASDNVPGVKGVGDKTALKLLGEYKSLDGIYEHAHEIKGVMGKKIIEGKEMAYFSKKLIRLETDIPLEECLDAYACHNLNIEAAAQHLLKEGITSLAKKYAGEAIAETPSNQHASNQPSEKSSSNQHESGQGGALNPQHSPFDTTEILEIKKSDGSYTMITSIEEVHSIIDAALAQGYCALDTETTSLNIMEADLVGVSISLTEGSAYYIPLKMEAKEGDLPFLMEGANQTSPSLELETLRTALAKLFSSTSILLIFHNAKYDIQVLRRAGIFDAMPTSLPTTSRPPARIFDTMIAAWLLDADWGNFSLDALAQNQLGIEMIAYKDIVQKGMSFADVPLDVATQYAAEDADITLRLYARLLQKLLDEDLAQLFYELEMPLVHILAEMECEGIRIESSDLEQFSAELGTSIAQKEKDIFEEVGHEFNIASPKQLQEVLFTERKLTPGKKTKTGYSTDTSVLENLASEDTVPGMILDYRGLAKLKSTYVDALPALADAKGRIHTSFIQTGTATGRLSSRDPNLQNIPIKDESGRKIRSAFKANKGRVLVSADYSQIELVILAHLSGDTNLCDAFNSGVDVHKKTASLIFNVLPDDVNAEMRRIAKTINFGVMYGMSAFRLANELRIPRGQAASFINMYFETYSGVAEYMETTKQKARELGYVETLMGRRRFIRGIHSANKIERAGAERIAVNTPIQGSAADIVKTAMIRIDSALAQRSGSNNLAGARLLLQVHDELILECDEPQAPFIRDLLVREMESVIQLRVPLRVSVESGPSWGDFH